MGVESSGTGTSQMPRSVAKNHSMNMLLFNCGLYIFLIVVWVSEMYFLLSARRHYDFESLALQIWPLIYMLLSCLFLLFICLRSYFLLRRLEYRRQHVNPTITRLAAIPFQRNNLVFQVPFIINQKIDWIVYTKIAFGSVFWVLSLCAFYNLSSYVVWDVVMDMSVVYILLGGSLFICIVMALVAWHFGNVQFYVTDKGLLKKGAFQQQFMPWDEARLFAIDSVSIEKRGLSFTKSNRAGAPVFFELSSQKEIISWQWLYPQRWYSLQVARPVMGYAAYNQQMLSLISTIMEKTGQPLYDLRS